jgi:hypothetical protein
MKQVPLQYQSLKNYLWYDVNGLEGVGGGGKRGKCCEGQIISHLFAEKATASITFMAIIFTHNSLTHMHIPWYSLTHMEGNHKNFSWNT